MTKKITVIHHSADYDGVFCGEIARKFLPEARIVGWDFGNAKVPWPEVGTVYILDLSPDCIERLPDINEVGRRVVWIDHHKSSIAKWPEQIPGYRIDGVAASRLAWQWFTAEGSKDLPSGRQYLDRKVVEPLAVMLAGEYDVWQHENSNGEDITFQFGLDSRKELSWETLLSYEGDEYVKDLLGRGETAQLCYRKRDADIVRQRAFDLDFEGMRFIALNTARCNSQTFEAALKPEHDGCLAFYWNGKTFVVSLYGVPHKPQVDLSVIAVKHGGGGHKQACGFQSRSLPWLERPPITKGE
jgi:hypothetical protein